MVGFMSPEYSFPEVGVQWVGLSVVGSQFEVIHPWRDWVQTTDRRQLTTRPLGTRFRGAVLGEIPRDASAPPSSVTAQRYSGAQPSWLAKRRMQRICLRSVRVKRW